MRRELLMSYFIAAFQEVSPAGNLTFNILSPSNTKECSLGSRMFGVPSAYLRFYNYLLNQLEMEADSSLFESRQRR